MPSKSPKHRGQAPAEIIVPSGHVLVHFYGEHSLMWVKEVELVPLDLDDGAKLHDLKLWGREHHKSAHCPLRCLNL